MTTWAIRQQSALSVELCDDCWLVYVQDSGQTHLVDFLSGEVLLFLAAGPQPEEAIQVLAARLLDDPAIELDELRERLLQPLMQLAIIEPVS